MRALAAVLIPSAVWCDQDKFVGSCIGYCVLYPLLAGSVEWAHRRGASMAPAELELRNAQIYEEIKMTADGFLIQTVCLILFAFRNNSHVNWFFVGRGGSISEASIIRISPAAFAFSYLCTPGGRGARRWLP